jgi:hypothetical protein
MSDEGFVALKGAGSLNGPSGWEGSGPGKRLPLAVRVLRDNLLDPLFLGHLLNLLFMVCYTILDFARGWDAANPKVVSVGFIVLGVGYVGDAWLYLRSWGEEWPTGVALAGEVLNLVGSVIYACSAVMYLYQSQVADSDAVFIIEATATFIFLLDAVLYLMAWYAAEPVPSVGRTGCHPLSINLWGHLLNVAPAIIYVISAVNGLMLHFSTRDSLIESAEAPPGSGGGGGGGGSGVREGTLGDWRPEHPANVVREMAKVYIYGDLLWTIDAAVLMVGWCMDTCVEAEEGEEGEEGMAKGLLSDDGGEGSEAASNSGSAREDA